MLYKPKESAKHLAHYFYLSLTMKGERQRDNIIKPVIRDWYCSHLNLEFHTGAQWYLFSVFDSLCDNIHVFSLVKKSSSPKAASTALKQEAVQRSGSGWRNCLYSLYT